MGDRLYITVSGVDKLQAKLNRIQQDLGVREMGRALYIEGERIMMVSKHLVPVDTGVLRNTGHVTLPERTDHGVLVVLGYGGPAAPYAIHVHERTNVPHKVGQAKYLETPAVEAAAGMPNRIRDRLKRRLMRYRAGRAT